MTANNTTQTTYIPKFSYPFAQRNKTIYKDKLGSLSNGNYLFTKMGFWHGGIHFEGSMLRDFKSQEGIKCITDGEIVAYRINENYLDDGRGVYSTGFFLIKHKIEYPINNKQSFFSLYMHTAKKEDYIEKYSIKTQGEKIFLRSGYERSEYSPAVGEAIAANTKIIIDGNWIQNRARVLYVEGRDIDLSLNLTIHNSNVNDINKKDIPKLEEIFINKEFNKVIVLPTPIKIKAGETIGLMGEYNIEGERNVNCLHLEVFVNEQFKIFIQTAQTEDKKLPQSFNWAKILDAKSSRDHVSIFENLEAVFKDEDLKMNNMFKELFDLIDKGTQDNGDGMLEVHELEEATKNLKIKAITNKYVVKHSSEWDTTENMVDVLEKIVNKIDNSEFKNKDEYKEILKKEKIRIENLSFFSECRTIPDFPKSDMVYVINPIGLVNEFLGGCLITKEMLIAMGCIEASNDQTLIDALNKYCEQYEINTCLRVAHFLAQAAHESGGFTTQTESGKYKESIAIQSSCYSAYRNTTAGRNVQLTPRKNKKGEIVDYDCKQPEYFNCKYGGKNGNTQIDSNDPSKKYYYQINDGFNYRGRGIMQITGRGTYENYQNDHAQRNPNDIKDFVGNPDLVTSSKEYEVASGCSYWFNKRNPIYATRLNTYADEGSSDEVVLKISGTINGYWEKTKDKYDDISASEKIKWTKANDSLYIKTPNGYDELNKPFSRLPLFHKLKEYMGL